MKIRLCKGFTLVLASLLASAIMSIVLPLEAIRAQTTFTIWPTTTVPAVKDDGPDSAVEIGVKFRSDMSGTITGIRFYKASTNTGTHVANLWTSSGTKLATATFANETASGWQQANFSTPYAITANTVYVASYHTNVGHYSEDNNYFSGKGMDSPPLHALADGVSGFDGVYAYGSTSKFPTLGWKTSNYWIDVAFSTTVLPDTTPPTVTAFTIPATATTLTVAISSFSATDNVGVTGYMVSESATAPLAAGSGWSATAPSSYAFTTAGSKTLYAWAKDAAGNVSASRSASTTITLTDPTPPTVTAFTIPATATTLKVTISSFSATDNVGVTGYMVNESATVPLATASGWSATAPSSYTFTTAGSKTLYAWAKDAVGNVSASRSASTTITLTDTTRPTVTAFIIPTTATILTVPISTFSATDNVGVTGYMVTVSSTAPLATASGWSATAPSSYTFTSAGSKTLYAWAKDAAGNVSASKSASVVITFVSAGPEPAGWYAGDMHVHRSCGGSPEAVSSMFTRMNPNNLAVISLLADMGNGEVQNPVTDLPLVTGLDASISTSARILHWDTEWHWDATYSQYAHQALGGHIVALGLRAANQIWEEYTFPILDWAHQQNAIAGFAHLERLDNGIPQSLDCCVPIEYPVEVALGASDFISEDVTDIYSTQGMCPDCAIQAYYRLLNCGFRPGFAAGTDYPCNSSEDLGSLLTYVQVPVGQVTYSTWIEGIAKGRTVVSRNGHNEFLNLVVNSSATPGDEIKLPAAGSVQVSITWTATQNLTGKIQLVQNGVVVASQQASVSSTVPATLTAQANFTNSGWLSAQRVDSNGHHVVATMAVFVTVNNAPVRASATDAQFYVQWMDNLLTKTSRGGVWSSYFVNSLSEAQARYQSAKTMFQQIASEASALMPSSPTIFTSQMPNTYASDSSYELGTKFWADVSGQVTQVRLYTNALEGGNHNVRIWRVSDKTLLAGPYTWNIASGTEGWKVFTLPAPLAIAANTDYIVSVSNSSDLYYAEQTDGFDAPIVNGHLHTYVASGVYTGLLGTMPTASWQNTNYFRDVVFVPQ